MNKKLLLILFFFSSVAHAQLTHLLHVYESSSGFGSCIERDNSGNIFFAGRVTANSLAAPGDTIHNAGMYLTKMDAAGNQIWRANDIKGAEITPRQILIDDAENIYVVGNYYNQMSVGAQSFTTSIGMRKFFIAKYNSSGNFLWIKVTAIDESVVFSADIHNNNLFLCGSFSGTFNYYGSTLSTTWLNINGFVLELDSSGAALNSLQFGGGSPDEFEKVKVAPNGDVVLCGNYSGSFVFSGSTLINHGNTDCFVMKLDAGFNLSWLHTAGSYGADDFRTLAIDTAGKIYVGGHGYYSISFDPTVYTLLFTNYRCGFVASYSSSGTFLEAALVNYNGNVIDMALVNNLPVVCGRVRSSGSFAFDPSILFNDNSYEIDGYYVGFDSHFNALFAGKIGDNILVGAERCFKVLPVGNNNFLMTGYASKDIKMPDTTYHHFSTINNSLQAKGGYVFLQQLAVPNLTVTLPDTLVTLVYSAANPLVLPINLNGNIFYSNASSLTKAGYAKTQINNWTSMGATGNFIPNEVTINSSITNPPQFTGSIFLTFDFLDKNMMIRTAEPVDVCYSNVSSLTGPNVICIGDTISLTGNPVYWNYEWFPPAEVITQNGHIITSAPQSNTFYYYVAHNSSSTCFVGTKSVSVNNQATAHIDLSTTNSTGCSPIQMNYTSFNCVAFAGGTFVYFYRNGIQISSSSSASGTFSVTSLGDYYVKAVSGCGWDIYSDTISITNIIPPITTAGSLYSNASYMCPGFSAILTLINHPANVYFDWYYNGALIPNQNNDTIVVYQYGYYYVKVYNSCNSFLNSNSVTINNAGVTNANIYTSSVIQGCAGANVVFGSNITNYGPTAYTMQWLRDGVAIAGATSSSYTTAINGVYKLQVTHYCGISFSNTIVVHLNNPVVASINNLGSSTLCNGQSTTLTASPGIDYFFQWRLNGVDISGATNQSLLISSGGTYTCLINNYCNGNLSNAVVISSSPVLPDSISASGSLNICPGQSVLMTADYVVGVNYQWFRDGNPVNGAINNTYFTSIGGVYTCRFTNSCGVVFSNNLTLITFNLSNSVYAPGGTNLCSGDSVYLYAPPNALLSFQWQLNSVDIPGATNNFFYANQPGSYNCKFTSASCGDFYSSSIIINLFQFSSLFITSSQGNVLCSGSSINLSAPNGLGFTFQWLLNNATIAGATNSAYTAQASGTYSCVVNSSCLSDTTSTLIISQGPPAPTISILISGNDTICAGDSSLLISTTTNASTYQWNYNGADITGATNSVYSAQVQGLYHCTVNNFCGSAVSNSIQIYSVPAPNTNVTNSGDTVMCDGQTTVLSVNSNAAFTYQWYQDGLLIAGATDFQYVVTATGDYFCEMNSTCGQYFTSIIHIHVVALPLTPAFTITGNILDCITAAAGYQWYFNGNLIPGAVNQTYQATQSGYYTVEVYNINGCGTLAVPQYFNSQSFAPVADFTYNNNSICAGSCITFSDNSTNQPIFWLWSFQGGNPATSNQINPTVCYSASGNYDVQLITGNAYGYDTLHLTQIVTVNALPPTMISQLHDTLLTAPGYAAYQWYLNGTSISGATDNYYVAPSSGNYTVYVENVNGCSDVTGAPFSFLAKPSAAINLSNNNACIGNCISFTDLSTNQPTSWQWQLPGSSIGTSSSQNPVACYNLPGTYDVTLITSNATGADTFYMSNMITVHPNPPAPTISASGNMLTSSPGMYYQWYLNGSVISGAVYQQIIVVTSGLYWVEVTDSFGCTSISTDFNYVGIEEILSDGFQINISPNPADDLFNASFTSDVNENNLQMILVNELGQVLSEKVFEENNSSVTESFSTKYLAAGCYYLRIKSARVNITKKIMVVH